MISGLYTPLLKVMGILAFVFLLLPFVVRRPGGGERVKIDLRLVLILALTGVGFMFLEMVGIYKYQLYLHHPTLAMIVVSSSMILGAAWGACIREPSGLPGKKMPSRFVRGEPCLAASPFLWVPLWGHGLLLWLPIPVMLPLVFIAFAVLGFLLGHVLPLSIDRYSRGQANLLPWCWAITVTGSVFRTVLASILARDYGMFFVAVLGISAYVFVATVSVIGKALARRFHRDVGAAASPG